MKAVIPLSKRPSLWFLFSIFKSNVRETWRVILVSKADIFVAVHLYRSQQRDFADASHSKSAKSATRAVSYGIFSSENSYMQVKHLFCAESLCILAERLSQSETQLPLRQICHYSPPEEVGVFSTEINLTVQTARLPYGYYRYLFPDCKPSFFTKQERFLLYY